MMRHINRELTAKFHGIIIFLGIFHEGGKKLSGKAHVPDKISVSEKNVMGPLLDAVIDFGQDLLHGFNARHPAVGHDNIAKFAIEGTPPAGLEADDVVPVGPDKIVARNRT